jgi:hypothetical protein
MKKTVSVLIGLFLLFIFIGVLSHGDWHLKRNKHNRLPKGKLTQTDGQKYFDEAGLTWILQANSKNIFHQPDKLPQPAPRIPLLYPNVSPSLDYDPNYPNLKFLSPDGKGASFEAILQPDGTFLINGKKQGTYNYSDPTGFMGYLEHVLLDVIPHFFSSDYDDSLNNVIETS